MLKLDALNLIYVYDVKLKYFCINFTSHLGVK